MIKLNGISKTYNSGKPSETLALNNVSLSLPNKGLVFIIGKSGSGKSTLLNILGLLDVYDAGEYSFHGEDINVQSNDKKDLIRAKEIGSIGIALIAPLVSATRKQPIDTIKNNT